MKRLIMVHGDKGGVGKTHVAQLTAAAFLASKRPVVLIDGDAKNPGLHRYFDGKPDPVRHLNVRTSDGFDGVFEEFLQTSNDVLVDLPAGGSDVTANFTCAGSAAGSVDIETLMPDHGGRLTIMFVIDQGRDGLVALDDELTRLPAGITDWIIVLNHRTGAPFDRFNNWVAEKDLGKAIILNMPSLDRKVIETLVTAKKHFGEIDTLGEASALMKMRAKSALRVWTGELAKAGLLDG